MVKKVGPNLNKELIIRKQIDSLSEQLDIEKKKSEEYLTRLKYLQADFENFEKRIKRQNENLVNLSAERVIQKIIPILDEIELAINESQKIQNSIHIVKGLEMILTNLNKILKQEGVVIIDALGYPFDPLKHEVSSFIETGELNENIVVKELRKGYLLNNKLIRPSTVVISRNNSN